MVTAKSVCKRQRQIERDRKSERARSNFVLHDSSGLQEQNLAWDSESWQTKQFCKEDKTQFNTQVASKSNLQHKRSELKNPTVNLNMDLQTGEQC